MEAKKTVSIYVNPDAYNRFKDLCHSRGTSVSAEMDQMIKQAVGELTGGDYERQAEQLEYEQLKARYLEVVKQTDKLKKQLRKKGLYEQLLEYSVKSGIDRETLGNLEEVAAEMLQGNGWEGSVEDLHLFISLLEVAREKKVVEKRLSEIRLQGRRENET